MIVSGNRVLCLVVLFLLQSAGWMAMIQGGPSISVAIVYHLVHYGSIITSGAVTYSNSKSHCEANGGYVLSAFHTYLRKAILKDFGKLGISEDIVFYIGADAEYSVHNEPDPAKRYVYSVPSLNCIYKWNQGLWANALGDGAGVGFYKGSDPSVQGATVINEYVLTVVYTTAINDKPSIIRQKRPDDKFVFALIPVQGTPSLPSQDAMVVCEVQNTMEGYEHWSPYEFNHKVWYYRTF